MSSLNAGKRYKRPAKFLMILSGFFIAHQKRIMTDQEFLLLRRPSATDDEIESYLERVAIMVEDGGICEDRATRLAL